MTAATEPLSWMEHAECRGMNSDTFYRRTAAVEEAKKVCARCPVSAECLTHAIAMNERHGIWGGKSEQERRAMRRAMRRTRPPAPSVTDQVVSMMRPDVTYSAENLRQLIGHRSHSTVTAALRALVDDGRVVCVRQFRNSRLPALYQLAGGGGS